MNFKLKLLLTINAMAIAAACNASEVANANTLNQLPALSLFKGSLMNGAFVPTSGTGKTPIAIRTGFLASLPNGYIASGGPGGCVFITNAKGNLSQERAYFEIESLTCQTSNGKVFESRSVRGYVVGEDGINGLTGPLSTKQGAILAQRLLQEIKSGASDDDSQQAQQLKNFKDEIALQLTPGIDIDPGRKVIIVLREPVKFEGLIFNVTTPEDLKQPN